MNITLSIPALNGGVSNQPEPLRLPQQAEVSDNVIGTVIDGLRVRPPTEYQGVFLGFPTVPTKEHAIYSDDGHYCVTAQNGYLNVYSLSQTQSFPANFQAQPLTVRNQAGTFAGPTDFSYLETTDPQRDLRFLTLNEYTIVLNRSVKVREDAVKWPSTPSQAVVAIVSGSYSKYYRIRVSHADGDLIEVLFETRSSDGTPPGGGTKDVPAAEHSIKTDVIATELDSLLRTGLGSSVVGGQVIAGYSSGLPAAKWAIDRSGSLLRIKRLDGTDFTITVTESVGGTSMSLVHKEVQLFSDLPAKAPVGMKTKVIGDPEKSTLGYWVEFEATKGSTAVAGEWADGYWTESVEPATTKGLDYTSMPHVLIRQANGEFRFTPLTGVPYLVSGIEYSLPKWDSRLVGDNDTNKQPQFVGKTIQGMVFHEGRLGLLCDDALTLSETREPFNFYRTSVLDVLDSDRIEIKLPSVRAETLTHVISVGGDILLFSESNQYVVRSEGAFAPNSVSLITAGRYDSDPVAEPIQVRSNVFVPGRVGAFGRVQEIKIVGDSRPNLEALDLTASANRYLGPIRMLATTPQVDVVVAVPEDSDGTLWIYTHFYNGQDKVQQAWQRFEIAGLPKIRHAWFVETVMFLVCDFGDGGVHVVRMRMETGANDYGKTLVHLDLRLGGAQYTKTLVGGNTKLVLPYQPGTPIQVLEYESEKEVRVLSVSGSEVILQGDFMDKNLWVGCVYAWRHVLSRVFLSDQGSATVVDGDIRLDTGRLYFSDSGAFSVAVIRTDLSEFVNPYSGPYLGMGANYQKLRVTSGKFEFPIREKASECRIALQGKSPWGGRFVSMDVNARHTRTAKGPRR